MKKSIIVSALLILLFTSCKKSNETQDLSITKENIVGVYKWTGWESSTNGRIVSSGVPLCQQDDLYTLNIDGSTKVNELGVVCTTPYLIIGTWTLDSSGFFFEGVTGKITKLTKSTLEVTDTKIFNDYYGSEVKAIRIWTFTRQ